MVLDPFAGNGTTGQVAKRWSRKWCSVELSYAVGIEIAASRMWRKRLEPAQEQHTNPKRKRYAALASRWCMISCQQVYRPRSQRMRCASSGPSMLTMDVRHDADVPRGHVAASRGLAVNISRTRVELGQRLVHFLQLRLDLASPLPAILGSAPESARIGGSARACGYPRTSARRLESNSTFGN